MTLAGRTALITGATSGIGLACAQLLHARGAKLVLTGRRAERLEALRARFGEAAHTLALDARDRAGVEAAVHGLPEAFSRVDILINNAGLALGLSPLEETPPEEIEQMVDTNIKGVLYITRALLPGMVARDLGHIVNLGSIAGTYPYPGGNVYGATKAFLKQFSLNLRADMLGKNVRVTNIEPGMVETEFSAVRFHGDRARAGSIYAGMQPLTGEDIARAVAWCLEQPAHVNVNRLEIMPTAQAFAPLAVARQC